MRSAARTTSRDDTFTRHGGSLSVNVPRLYCETIGAPVSEDVVQYCLRRDGWRREQLLDLARRIEGVVSGGDRGAGVSQLEAQCREAAREMLDNDDVTPWTPMDDEGVSGVAS